LMEDSWSPQIQVKKEWLELDLGASQIVAY